MDVLNPHTKIAFVLCCVVLFCFVLFCAVPTETDSKVSKEVRTQIAAATNARTDFIRYRIDESSPGAGPKKKKGGYWTFSAVRVRTLWEHTGPETVIVCDVHDEPKLVIRTITRCLKRLTNEQKEILHTYWQASVPECLNECPLPPLTNSKKTKPAATATTAAATASDASANGNGSGGSGGSGGKNGGGGGGRARHIHSDCGLLIWRSGKCRAQARSSVENFLPYIQTTLKTLSHVPVRLAFIIIFFFRNLLCCFVPNFLTY